MPAPGFSRLPNELLVKIARYLDRQSKVALCKTSRHVHAAVEHTLYEAIDFTWRNRPKSRDLLIRLLSRPKLGESVRTMTCKSSAFPRYEPSPKLHHAFVHNAGLISEQIRHMVGDNADITFQLQWLAEIFRETESACLALILAFAPNVQSIRMEGNQSMNRDIMEQAVEAMLKASVFKKLKFLDIGRCPSHDARGISTQPSLQSLGLSYCFLPQPLFGNFAHGLQELHLRHCEMSVANLVDAVSSGNLQHLTELVLHNLMPAEDDDIDVFGRLISVIAEHLPALKSLEFMEMRTELVWQGEIANLRTLTNLESLQIECAALVDNQTTTLADLWLNPCAYLPSNLCSLYLRDIPFDELVIFLLLGVKDDFGPRLNDIVSRIPLETLSISVFDRSFSGRPEVKQVLGYAANELIKVGLEFAVYEGTGPFGNPPGPFWGDKVIGPGLIKDEYDDDDLFDYDDDISSESNF